VSGGLACTGDLLPSGGAAAVPLPGPQQSACRETERLPTRVTRLSDRQLSRAVQQLTGLRDATAFATSSGSQDDFLANQAASVNGAVGLQLQELAERAAEAATSAGAPALACQGDEVACARAFVRRFGGRAFRRPLTGAEEAGLLGVYEAGRSIDGTHAGGVRLVIQAALQAPAFLYLTELGGSPGAPSSRLSAYELASKISFFLRDGLPDDALWAALESGRFETPEDVAAQVDRLLATPEVQKHITELLARMFQLPRVLTTTKAPSVTDFNAELATSMKDETLRFIDDVLWRRGGQLSELFTSRRAFVDDRTAALYGVTAPGTGVREVVLPERERAGILTRAALMTLEALPDESSVVHRGVFVSRELLCFHPPPPSSDDLAAGDALKKAEPTERGRSLKRMAIPRCAGCHQYLDPVGVSFEHYDTLGRYRAEIATPAGPVPVDSTWDLTLPSLEGPVTDAVALSERLATSPVVRECLVRQFASAAYGQRLSEAQGCGTRSVQETFTSSGGDLVALIRGIATWPGLRERQEEAP